MVFLEEGRSSAASAFPLLQTNICRSLQPWCSFSQGIERTWYGKVILVLIIEF
jgi:hypothetical protein